MTALSTLQFFSVFNQSEGRLVVQLGKGFKVLRINQHFQEQSVSQFLAHISRLQGRRAFQLGEGLNVGRCVDQFHQQSILYSHRHSNNETSRSFRSIKLSVVPPANSVMSSQKVKVAVLDDYQGVARPLFAELEKKYPGLEVVEFPDTIPSYALESTSNEDKEKLVDRLKPFTIISTMRERTAFPPALLRKLPNLEVLLTTGLKNASIDLTACTNLGVVVAGTTGTGFERHPRPKKGSWLSATTQHTWALLLGVVAGVASDDAAVKSGGWQSGFTTGLPTKTLGLLGLGNLGFAVGRIGKIAFDMNVIAWSSSLTQEAADEKVKSAGLPTEDHFGRKTVLVVSKEELFKSADVLSVHYVLSDRSRGIVGAKDLALMKPTAFLVNTSRGPLIDEEALLTHLKDGKIKGAALDVFDVEPLPKDSPWRTTEWGKAGRSQVLLSPHMGYVEEDTILSWYEETVDNVERYLEGKELKAVLPYKSPTSAE